MHAAVLFDVLIPLKSGLSPDSSLTAKSLTRKSLNPFEIRAVSGRFAHYGLCPLVGLNPFEIRAVSGLRAAGRAQRQRS